MLPGIGPTFPTCRLSLRLDSTEEGEFEPFPVAIDVVESDFAEPVELGLDGEAFVGRVFVGGGDVEGAEEAGVEFRGTGQDVFEVQEYSAGGEDFVDFGVEFLFAFVGAVVDGEAGDDGVELAEGGKGMFEIVVDDRNLRIVLEAGAGGLEHGGGEIERDTFGLGAIEAEEGQESSVAGAEI